MQEYAEFTFPGIDGIDFELEVQDEEQTNLFASKLAEQINAGDTLALWGDLGAGKTTFSKAFIKKKCIENAPNISSPTYNLIQIYQAQGFEIWHIDLYRLTQAEEALNLGLEEAFGESLCIIEWPQKMEEYLPYPRIDIGFNFINDSDNARKIKIHSYKDLILS